MGFETNSLHSYDINTHTHTLAHRDTHTYAFIHTHTHKLTHPQ